VKTVPNVCFHKDIGKWQAYANFEGKRHYIGLFENNLLAEQAVKQFKEANEIEICGRIPLLERTTYSDGSLLWSRHGRGHAKGTPVGAIDPRSGYRYARDFDGSKQYLHRLIWVMHFGPIPTGLEIDHINGNRSDNKIENLRLVSRSLNLKNKRVLKPNKTGHRGVAKTANKNFIAKVYDQGKTVRLGIFKTAELAGAARKQAEPLYGYHANHGRTAT